MKAAALFKKWVSGISFTALHHITYITLPLRPLRPIVVVLKSVWIVAYLFRKPPCFIKKLWCLTDINITLAMYVIATPYHHVTSCTYHEPLLLSGGYDGHDFLI